MKRKNLILCIIVILVAVIAVAYVENPLDYHTAEEPPKVGDTVVVEVKVVLNTPKNVKGRDILTVPSELVVLSFCDFFHLGTYDEDRWKNVKPGKVYKVRGRIAEPSPQTCHVFRSIFGVWKNGSYMPEETEENCKNHRVYRLTNVDWVRPL